MRVILWGVVLGLLWPLPAGSFDPESYCAGWCRGRYEDGIVRGDKCACIDYYPIRPDNRIDPFYRPPARRSHEY